MFVQFSFAKVIVVLSLTVGFVNIAHTQSKIESFGISEGYERLYFDKAYHLKHIETEKLNTFSHLDYVGDVIDGKVIFKSVEGHYGLMNEAFETVIAPEWIQINDFGYGYYALAKYSGMTVTEDRGEGVNTYPLLSWKIYSSEEGEFISDMELINPICIYGEILAKNHQSQDVKIYLNKINFGYTDPVMKALTYVKAAPVAKTAMGVSGS